MKLTTLYTQAQSVSEIIQQFQTKHGYKFVKFIIVPQEPEFIEYSVAQFEIGHFSLKDIIHDLNNNIEPLKIFDYFLDMEYLASKSSEEWFVNNAPDFEAWLKVN